MNKKVLYTAKIDSHIRHFHIPFLQEFKNRGYTVHVASEGTESFENCDKKFNVKFGTNPFSKDVKKGYKELSKIIKENKYDVIVTNTAIASVITRLAVFFGVKRKKRPRVVYIAHGFHFYKGGPVTSWLLYFPIELILGLITDDLILINNEDFKLANKCRIGRRRHILHGVGIDLSFFRNNSKNTHENFIITYVAEININKNQILLLEAMKLLKDKYPNIYIQLVGDGSNKEQLESQINELGINDNVKLLGYRHDVRDILLGTDIIVATSLREGLPVNILEGMAMGLPIIATRCRGHVDLVKDDENGFIVSYDAQEIADKVSLLYDNEELVNRMSKESLNMIESYDINNIVKRFNMIIFNEKTICSAQSNEL